MNFLATVLLCVVAQSAKATDQQALGGADLNYEPLVLPPFSGIDPNIDSDRLRDRLLGADYAPLGRSCDPSLSACQAAAGQAARDHADRSRAYALALTRQLLRAELETLATEDQLRDIQDFLNSDAGEVLNRAVRSVTIEDFLRAIADGGSGVDTAHLPTPSALFEEFYALSEGLPRNEPRKFPPPPAPPPRVVVPDQPED
jgi:hypothetical protein